MAVAVLFRNQRLEAQQRSSKKLDRAIIGDMTYVKYASKHICLIVRFDVFSCIDGNGIITV